MENENIFLWVKAGIVGAVWAFSSAFGWMGWLILAWVGCMIADYISGSAAAIKAGEWSSAAARSGLWHKGGMILVVIVAAVADGVLAIVVANTSLPIQYTVLLLPVVVIWYILTELGSMLENATALGANVPAVLVKTLAAAKDKIDDLGEDQKTADKE